MRKLSGFAVVGAVLAIELSLATAAQAVVVEPEQVGGETVVLPLHQTTPILNSAYGEQGECPGSPAAWGWHFVLPTSDAYFVSLTTTFQTAGTVVTTVFGPPSDKHAYVYTATDDSLLSASAEVGGDTGDLEFFNLSHTCGGGTSSPSPSPSVSESPSPSPSGSVSPSPSVSPSESRSPSPSDSPQVSPSEIVTTSPSISPSVQGVKFVKTLPATGAGAPVGKLLATGLLTLLAGCLALAVSRRQPAGLHRR